MNTVGPYIAKQSTNFVPDPIEEHPQIVLTLYRLAYSISFSTLSDLFGVFISFAKFNVVIREMVRHMYDTYVVLPESAYAWKQEVIGFIENYEFSSIAAWDGFQVYSGTKLKKHYSFKKRYSISNMGLSSVNASVNCFSKCS